MGHQAGRNGIAMGHQAYEIGLKHQGKEGHHWQIRLRNISRHFMYIQSKNYDHGESGSHWGPTRQFVRGVRQVQVQIYCHMNQ